MKNAAIVGNCAYYPPTLISPADFVQFYRSLRLNIIPLHEGQKRPLVGWKPYQRRLATGEELATWFGRGRGSNIGVLCGRISRGLIIQDFERLQDYRTFYGNHPLLERQTLVVKTPHGGVHVYLRTPVEVRRSIRICKEPPVDLLGEGGFAVAPPSLVDGRSYEFEGEPRDILVLSADPVKPMIDRARALGWKVRAPSHRSVFAPRAWNQSREWRQLSHPDQAKIVAAIYPFWKRGARHLLTIYLVGLLMKRRIGEETACQLISKICDLAGDEEVKQRLTDVRYHYEKRVSMPGKVKGFSGLREILEGEAYV